MITIDCVQGEPEWFAARIGRLTASNMERVISPTGKESTQADKLMNELIGEIVTGKPSESFEGNAHSKRGKEWEPDAADFYSGLRAVELETVGFCLTNDRLVGCSPDRFVEGGDGLLEIKTGLPHILIESALNNKLEQDHRPQTQCALWVTGRKWVDTMLYHPLMKPIIVRAERNEAYITSMSGMAARFNLRMQERISLLRSTGYLEAA